LLVQAHLAHAQVIETEPALQQRQMPARIHAVDVEDALLILVVQVAQAQAIGDGTAQQLARRACPPGS
jgi:hypothetical protein